MKRTSSCPKCGDKQIIKAKAIDRGENYSHFEMTVATYEKPDALIFKGTHKSEVAAYVCGRCGFVEFYAEFPDELKIEK